VIGPQPTPSNHDVTFNQRRGYKRGLADEVMMKMMVIITNMALVKVMICKR
jgi:hypothetical protein